jgi:hypothetical protein
MSTPAERLAALDAAVRGPDRDRAILLALEDEALPVRDRAIRLAARYVEPRCSAPWWPMARTRRAGTPA